MGHPGQWKTLELITREYYWLGMTEFVKSYIKGCATCQTTKIRPPVKVLLKPNEIPDGPWETVTATKCAATSRLSRVTCGVESSLQCGC